jgi:ABC-type xylose transport system permease subunit
MSQISNLPLDTENTGVQEESSISTNATGAFPSKADYHQSAFGPGTEILVMTAAVIGGVSFMGGGEGNVVGLVAGVFILAVIGNGMQLVGWGTYAQYLVKGVIR